MAPQRTAVLIHGAWVTSSSWEHVARRLEARGYTCVTPDGPFKGGPIERLRTPDPRLATVGLEDLVEHFARHVRACGPPPLLVGHALGGLIAQMLLDRDLGCAAVAVGSAPPRGILPLHAAAMRAAASRLGRMGRRPAIDLLTFGTWQRDFAGSLPGHDQRATFERYIVPESGRIGAQLATSLLTGAGGLDFRNRHRKPLLLIAGDEDRLAPPEMMLANCRAYVATTQLQVLEGRGHWMLAEHDADDLADSIDRFARRFPADTRAPCRPLTARRDRSVVIIGAGPAGLATAAALKRRGVDNVVLETEPEAGTSWRRHYDGLRLHTMRGLSGLPGLPIPPAWGPWPAAQDFATYLQRYAHHHELDVVTGTQVTGVTQAPNGLGWSIETSRDVWKADRVVVATGLNRKPRLPAWSCGAAEGRIVHSSRYRGPETYAGREVLVVGVGNSGAEIALDLARGSAATVHLSVRGGPNLLPRVICGVPTQLLGLVFGALPRSALDVMMEALQRLIYGEARRSGLPPPTHGLFTGMKTGRVVPVIDTGFAAALRTGAIRVVAPVKALSGPVVELVGGGRIMPDIIIAATGFQPDLQSILGDITLDAAGLPRLGVSAEVEGAPGLYCAGYLVSPAGVLHAIGRQAEHIAVAIAGQIGKDSR